jgi:hypothetical protein
VVTFGAVAAVLAAGVAAALVLREAMAYDRPAPVARAARVPEPVLTVQTPEPVPEPVPEGSMLATLTAVEVEETSPLRRAGALAVLLTLTLLTAGAVAAGIYRGVSAFK